MLRELHVCVSPPCLPVLQRSLRLHTQASLGSLVVVFFLVLQFTARPYIRDRMDILEGLCAVSVFFYVFAGMLFTNANLSGEESVRENTCAAAINTAYSTRTPTPFSKLVGKETMWLSCLCKHVNGEHDRKRVRFSRRRRALSRG